MAPPLVRQVKAKINNTSPSLAILDAPPGVSCPFVETAKGSHFILFVVEPTPFGYHDFELSSRVVVELGIPWGVLINKYVEGESERVEEMVNATCTEKGGSILGRVSFSVEVAKGYSEGRSMVEADSTLYPLFRSVLDKISGLFKEKEKER
jgi:MinD superfamily P-loop ATPase